jgi:PncC family amidohydrolase
MITISIAESLTAGMICSEIANTPGASKWFKGGIITYSIESKADILGLDLSELKESNGVSLKIAADMAESVANLFNSELGISTTGYAESSKDHEQGAFIVLYNNNNNTYSIKYVEGNKSIRNEFRQHVTSKVIEIINTYKLKE